MVWPPLRLSWVCTALPPVNSIIALIQQATDAAAQSANHTAHRTAYTCQTSIPATVFHPHSTLTNSQRAAASTTMATLTQRMSEQTSQPLHPSSHYQEPSEYKVQATHHVAGQGTTSDGKPVTVHVRYTKLFIDGQFVDSQSGKTYETVNPATGQVICRVAEAQPEDVDNAVKAAKRAFDEDWSVIAPSRRSDLMYKLATLIERDAEELSGLEALDNGKPFKQARRIDVQNLITILKFMAGYAQNKVDGRTIASDPPYSIKTVLEPIGVVGAIVPWNFPLETLSWKLAPALAAGCTIVVKPSDKTALSSLKLAALTQEAGFPNGVYNVVPGFGANAGNALVNHDLVSKIVFTGSTAVGKEVAAAAAKSNLKRVQLELGGKSPVVILPDYDIGEAARGAAHAVYYNAGQVCCAGSRTFVHESIYDQFLEAVVEVARNKPLLCDEPDNPEGLQPVIDERQRERILKYIEIGKKEGARLLYGGEAPRNKPGYYIQPTVFADVQDHHTIAREEIFGPVMSILKWSSIDEVIKRANDTIYGLGASVWTNDISQAEYIAGKIESGTVWINCHNVLLPWAPFGGYKQSGYGRDQGYESLLEYVQVKCINARLSQPSGVPKLERVAGSGRVKATAEQDELKRDETMKM